MIRIPCLSCRGVGSHVLNGVKVACPVCHGSGLVQHAGAKMLALVIVVGAVALVVGR